MTTELWVPPSYKQPSTVVEIEKAETPVRSNLFPSATGRGGTLLGGLARTAGVGSPHLTRQELISLYRRHSWVRAALRRIGLIAISEGWEIVRSEEVQEKDAPQDEYDYLLRFFEPEMSQVANIRQTQLPRQKMLVTFIRLRLLGEVYWELAKDGFGDVVDFVPMFGTVLPIIDKRGNFVDPQQAFVQLMGYDKEFFALDEVLRFEIPDIDGRLGVSDLEAVEVAATTDLFASVWNRNTFKNNRTPPGAWMFDPTTTPDQMRDNRQALDAMYSGVESANTPYLALKGTASYQVFGAPFQRDQEYLKGRRFNRDEILAVLGMSPGILGIVDDVNRANLDGLIEIAYREEAQPLQEIVEETINLWVRAQGITAWEFHFIRPSFGNEADEEKIVDMRIKSGQQTPNQARVARGEAPYPGGDRYWMQNSVSEIGRDPDDEAGPGEEEEEPTTTPPDGGGDEDEDEEEEQEGDVEQKRLELAKWKRVAIRMAKGELRWRPFKSRVLSSLELLEIHVRLGKIKDDPEAVRDYFDGMLKLVGDPAYGPGRDSRWFNDALKDSLGQATPEESARVDAEFAERRRRMRSEKAVEDGLEDWPEYARERLADRLRSDLDYQIQSLEERRTRLEEAEVPGL